MAQTIPEAINALTEIGSKARIVYSNGGPHCEVIDIATGKAYLMYPEIDQPGAESEDAAIFGAVPLAIKAEKPLTKGQQAITEAVKPISEENVRLRKELEELRRKMEEKQPTSKPSGKSPTTN